MIYIDYPFYWILICLLVGALYAFLLYSKKNVPWSKAWNKVLFLCRFLVVSLLCLLLLDPYLKLSTNEAQNKKVVFLWDNSRSLILEQDSQKLQSFIQQTKGLASSLESEKNVNVVWGNLDNQTLIENQDIQFNKESTPIHQALQNVKENNADGLINEVILFSDGIYNLGPSPDYFEYNYKLSTVALGDTTPVKDIFVSQLKYNKTAYQGNLFPLNAVINKSSFGALELKCKLFHEGKLLKTERVKFDESTNIKEVEFLVEAKAKGLNSYKVIVDASEGEMNTNNNSKVAYVNVIDGKKKVLLLASAPHPDISAIHRAILQNDNFELDIVTPHSKSIKGTNYDLVIAFHLPSQNGIYNDDLQKFKAQKVPIWFVVGARSPSLNLFNQLAEDVNLKPWSEIDVATVTVNKAFSRFDLDKNQLSLLAKLPPIEMPYQLPPVSQQQNSFFVKKIGQLTTDQSIAAMHEVTDSRQAVLFLEGFWKWRIYEYLQTGEYKLFDSWIIKTIKWLTSKESKEQFNVYPVAERFKNFEEVKLKVESYNEVYEEVAGNNVQLKVVGVDTVLSFDFKTVLLDPYFELGNLKSGVYSFTAKTLIGGNTFEQSGQFIVEENDIEASNLQADHSLLKRMAEKNEGNYFKSYDVQALKEYLGTQEYPQMIKTSVKVRSFNSNYLAFALICILLFAEWFLRRYYGSY